MKNLFKSNLSWFLLFLSLYGILLPYGMQESETYSELKIKNYDLQKELNLTKEKLNEVEKVHQSLKDSMSSVINAHKEQKARQYKEKTKKYKSKIFQCMNQIEELKKHLSSGNNLNWKTQKRFSLESMDSSISPEIFKTRDNLSAMSIESPDMFKTPTRLITQEEKNNILSANKENILPLTERKNKTTVIAIDNELFKKNEEKLNQENQKLKSELLESKNLKAFQENHKTIQHYEEITTNYIDLIGRYKKDSEKLKNLYEENNSQKETIDNLLIVIQQYQQEHAVLKKSFVEQEVQQLRSPSDDHKTKPFLPKQKDSENKLFLEQEQKKKENEKQLKLEKQNTLKFKKQNAISDFRELKKVYKVICAENEMCQNLHIKPKQEDVKIDELKLNFESSPLKKKEFNQKEQKKWFKMNVNSNHL